MDNPEVTFIPDRNHHDSEQRQRSGTSINLMDMDVVDEVACTPSFHSSNVSTPSFSAEQRMQRKLMQYLVKLTTCSILFKCRSVL